jgi:hypothetical protein
MGIDLGNSLLKASINHFWSEKHGLFVDNLPWLKQESGLRLHERTLTASILFDQCPDNQKSAASQALVDSPKELGKCYPANTFWRYEALGEAGRADVIIREIREKWADLEAVKRNNTLPEHWNVRPDSRDQWSHCPVAPLIALYRSVLGIKPLSPGFKKFEIRPQLNDIDELDFTACTVGGPIRVQGTGDTGNRRIDISAPSGCRGQLVVDENERIPLEKASYPAPTGCRRYLIPEDGVRGLVLLHS